jgi:predicted nucleotidyltransferase
MPFDPARILAVLAEHGVDYVVIGGIGGVLHGSPMTTNDLDVVPALKKANMDSLAAALNEMNARILSHEAPDGIEVEWTAKDLQRWIVDFRFLNVMTDYGQLDLIHRPEGTTGYQELAANAEEMDLDDVVIRVAALEDIIRSEQAVARERDLEQLPTLRLLLEERNSTVAVSRKAGHCDRRSAG